jgi:hypothetical protein
MIIESSTGRCENTEPSDLLRADHPGSLRSWAMFLGAPVVWNTCGALDKTVMTGQPGIKHGDGTSFWTYLAEPPWERFAANFLGLVRLGCMGILLRHPNPQRGGHPASPRTSAPSLNAQGHSVVPGFACNWMLPPPSVPPAV